MLFQIMLMKMDMKLDNDFYGSVSGKFGPL